ncbi:MAG: T9SS type A sorting domain-containing protein [Bacteroidia bacterium]|nr:T9SS type A sorting domain-containing protein [Bacteroidia bacterium]
MGRKNLILYCAALLAANFIFPFGAKSQSETHIRCYTVENEQSRRLANPSLQTDAQFEAWMADQIRELKKNPSPRGATRVIPTVVHVIYSNSTENISDAQIQSQIDVLNEDFQRLNPDTTNTPAGFKPAAANCDIEFCLAALDPNGGPTNGIDRIPMSGSPFGTNTIDNTIKPATVWDPTQYFNLWVVNMSGGILGYAQFPEAAGLSGIGTGNGSANTDGVVVTYYSVGRPPQNPFNGAYNGGRTATHEIGHWLGLRHIWGDGGCGVDDFCADTPTSDNSNFGCPTNHVACNSVDMVQNYMDYTDDNCMNIFTNDQKSRMDVVLANSIRRQSLLTSTVCTPAPVINYLGAQQTVVESGVDGTQDCRGYVDIDLTLRIGLAPVGDAHVQVTIQAGTATLGLDYDTLNASVDFLTGATADQHVTVRIYDDGEIESPEDLTVGIVVTGNTDATAAPAASYTIHIEDNDHDPAAGIILQLFTENFENGLNGWSVGNVNGPNQWKIAGGSGGMSGAGSAYITRNSGTSNTYRRSQSASSRLISPMIDATGYSAITLDFLWHCDGEFANGIPVDYGSLSYSLDGVTFINFLGNTFASPFVNQPANTTQHVNLPAAVDGQQFYLGFDWQNDANNQGNNPPFAVDDIVVSAGLPIAIETQLNALDEQYLGPNATVYWYDNTTGDVLVGIENLSSHDYGCTSVTIDRAGTGASLYEFPGIGEAVTNKSYLITPANNNPSGQYRIKLYFTDAEISGWESTTSQSRNDAVVVKSGGPISNVTPSTPNGNGNTNYYSLITNRGAYGVSDFFIQGEFNTGFSGFAAGIPEGFVARDGQISAGQARIFPNPFSQTFRVELDLNQPETIHMALVDVLGNQIGQWHKQGVAGKQQISSDPNLKLSPGIYFLHLSAGKLDQTFKLISL